MVYMNNNKNTDNTNINKGMVVQFKVPDYDLMTGTVERVLNKDAHGNEVPVTYHVVVSSNHPRNSGLFQLNSDHILKVVV